MEAVVRIVIDGQSMQFASVDEAVKQAANEWLRYKATKNAMVEQRIRLGQWLLAVKELAGHGEMSELLDRHSIPPRAAQRAMQAAREDHNRKIGQSFAAEIGGGDGAHTSKYDNCRISRPRKPTLILIGTMRRLMNALHTARPDADDIAQMDAASLRCHEKALACLYRFQQMDPDDSQRPLTRRRMQEGLRTVAFKAEPGALAVWVTRALEWLDAEIANEGHFRYDVPGLGHGGGAGGGGTEHVGPGAGAANRGGAAGGGDGRAAGAGAGDGDASADDLERERIDFDQSPGTYGSDPYGAGTQGHGTQGLGEQEAGTGAAQTNGGPLDDFDDDDDDAGSGAGGVPHHAARRAQVTPAAAAGSGKGNSKSNSKSGAQLTFTALYESQMRSACEELMETVADVASMEMPRHEAEELLAQVRGLVERLKGGRK